MDRLKKKPVPMEPPSIEILVIGNELLNGTTLDTNSHWLSITLTRLGFKVIRKTTIQDELQVIVKEFRLALRRKPSWLFSLGGLGPTYDDKTLEGLAAALGVRVSLNSEAVNMLKERYRIRAAMLGTKLGMISNASLKMARLPEGSIPLKNSQGSAPGVFVRHRGVKVVSLPGVPREMKAIFVEDLVPKLKKETSRSARMEEWYNVVGIGESRLAPTLVKLSKRLTPTIYVKSHPIGFRNKKSLLNIQIIASAPASESDFARKMLNDACAEIQDGVRRLHGSLRHTKSIG